MNYMLKMKENKLLKKQIYSQNNIIVSINIMEN